MRGLVERSASTSGSPGLPADSPAPSPKRRTRSSQRCQLRRHSRWSFPEACRGPTTMSSTTAGSRTRSSNRSARLAVADPSSEIAGSARSAFAPGPPSPALTPQTSRDCSPAPPGRAATAPDFRNPATNPRWARGASERPISQRNSAGRSVGSIPEEREWHSSPAQALISRQGQRLYSYRSACTGLPRASRSVCAKTVAQAIARATAPATRKYAGLSEIRYA
jgi:hypothetical protein